MRNISKKNLITFIISCTAILLVGCSGVDSDIKADNQTTNSVESVRKENQTLIAQVSKLSVDATEMQSKYDVLKSQSKKDEKEIKSLNSKVSKLQLKVKAKDKKIKAKNKKIKSLNKKIRKLEAKSKSASNSSSSNSTYTKNKNTTTKNVSSTVYITNTGAKYHRNGCRYLSRSQISISEDDAISQGYDACSVCRP